MARALGKLDWNGEVSVGGRSVCSNESRIDVFCIFASTQLLLKLGPQMLELRVGIRCWILGPNWIPSLLPGRSPACMIYSPVGQL